MIKDHGELFKRICSLAGKPIDDHKVFYEDWKRLCKMSDFPTVLKAWEQIKIENTFYFQLKLWHDKLDYLEEQKKVNEPKEKHTRTKKDADMIAWNKNSIAFRESKITLKEYLGTALKIGQMKPREFNSEVARYERLKYDFNKPITRTGLF